jgi:hypothetical protein
MSYVQRQDRKNREYADAWKAWERSLPPEDLAGLRSAGIDGPASGSKTSKWGPDIGDSVRIGLIEADIEAEALSERDAEQRPGTLAGSAIVRILLADLLALRSPPLELRCLALAVDFPMPGIASGAELARMHGVTRAAVSLKVRHYQTLLGVDRSSYNKASPARNRYRETNRRRTKIA